MSPRTDGIIAKACQRYKWPSWLVTIQVSGRRWRVHPDSRGLVWTQSIILSILYRAGDQQRKLVCQLPKSVCTTNSRPPESLKQASLNFQIHHYTDAAIINIISTSKTLQEFTAVDSIAMNKIEVGNHILSSVFPPSQSTQKKIYQPSTELGSMFY